MEEPFLAKAVQKGVKTCLSCVLTLYFKLAVDLLTYTMLLPLLPQYFHAEGGTDWQYLLALLMSSFAALLGSFVFGGLCDKGIPMRRLYVISSVICLGGNFLYAFDDAFSIKTPLLIIVGYVISVGAGSTLTLLTVYLTKVCLPEELGVAMVVVGLARSAALFLGPTLTTSLDLIVKDNFRVSGGSLFGKFALPATILMLLYLALLVATVANWKDPPRDECVQKSERNTKTGWQFAKQPFSIAFLLSNALQSCTILSIEILVPLFAWHTLGWKSGWRGGYILSSISVAVLLGQFSAVLLINRVTDCWLAICGCFGAAAVALLALVVWSIVFGLDSQLSLACAQSHWLVLTAPLVLLECFAPWMLATSGAIWTRVVNQEAPTSIGFLNALRYAMIYIGISLAPAVVGLLYANGIPYMFFMVLFLFSSTAGVLLLANVKKNETSR